MTVLTYNSDLISTAKQTRLAAMKLALLSTAAKNEAIEAIAIALESAQDQIIQANITDCEAAQSQGIAKPLYKRLQLDEHKLRDNIAGVRDIGKLSDPVGSIQIHRKLDTGLILKRVSCPLGVLGIIFEARPEAAIQIASLAIKSGNGVILKGGKEAIRSCEAIVKA
ncbi:MAG: gamma-glutamyl-phosphate reductase, partial [Rivularia sp. (in: cyanobacteria)]